MEFNKQKNKREKQKNKKKKAKTPKPKKPHKNQDRLLNVDNWWLPDRR